jgi:UDP-glucuronate decarboxylase
MNKVKATTRCIKIIRCRLCNNPKLTRVITLDPTPPANAFLKKVDLSRKEYKYPLIVNYCPKCGQLQLSHVVSPDILFKKYVYASSTSKLFIEHFEKYAKEVFDRFHLDKQSFVIDIGSNDGILLKPFKKLGVKVLGIDPAVDIAKKATAEGIPTWPNFFDLKLTKKITAKYQKADIVTANNVFAHINDLDQLTKSVFSVLKDEGVFTIEFPYLINFLKDNLFDTIYHEHLSYLSIRPLISFFKKHGMEIFDVKQVETHGGSIRVFVKKTSGKQPVCKSVNIFVNNEIKNGLSETRTYLNFAKKIESNKDELVKMLATIKKSGKKIVGYGAPAKGNTLLNYFRVDSSVLDYIVDDSPYKQGLYTPGTHIPVVPASYLKKDRPDYVLILAWNYAAALIKKMDELKKEGVGFIIPAPKPTLIKTILKTAKKVKVARTKKPSDLDLIYRGLKDEVKLLEGKTLLISGGSGFIGNYVNATIYYLNKKVLKKPCQVITIDNYITGSRKNYLADIEKDKNFTFLHHDVRLPLNINQKIDYIIHAAGLASPVYYKKYPLETIESAILGAKNLLELARVAKTKSFLFFSSSEIYGDPEPQSVPTPETYHGKVSSIGPRACYDESKRLAETFCITYNQVYGVPIKIVRPFNVYGPGMKYDDRRVIPTFLYEGLRGHSLPVHDRGVQTRTFCYISDAVIGFFKVLLKGRNGEVYNIGNDKPELGMYELAVIIAGLLKNNVQPRRKSYPKDYPAGEPQRRCPDIAKAEKELEFKPRIGLDEGLSRTIKWFKEEYKDLLLKK